ncbi:DUF4350 domain-containing protein [Lihuaxuella thermophila]|uniref:DUF4350 domain-containing protein n=1 Tax=Lihuaxuella thermophila TaxID=1173111 RepID=A0A1H8FIQ4_9BACL|nr:DUF4350 domain-containing protein [Lihuaxuella thermophila]SEN31613.1 protein of unknown function [Lihuaxuella thermophila]
MRRDQVWLTVTVVLVCAIIAFSLSQWLSFPGKVPYSAKNPKELGVKAFYLFVEKRGKKVGLWESGYNQLPAAGGNTLMVISPQGEALSQADVKDLRHWVQMGNQLVLWAPVDSDWVKAFRLKGEECLASSNFRFVIPRQNDPWLGKVQLLEWTGDQCVSPNDETRPLLVDREHHTLVAEQIIGRGRIVYIPEVSLVTNDRIDQADHIALLLSLIENRPGTIWFDETVHSLSSQLVQPPKKSDELSEAPPNSEMPEPSMPSFFSLIGNDAWPILLQLIFLVVLWLYAKGKRFAAPRFERVKEKRNALEYVEAMAVWYSRSGIRKEALMIQHQELRKEILETLRLPRKISDESLSRQIEQCIGTDFRRAYDELTSTIVQVVSSKRNISQAAFIQWSASIQELRKELEQWKNTPRISAASRL